MTSSEWVQVSRGAYLLLMMTVMQKAAGHKYLKRVATGRLTATGKPIYRYYYKVGHGGGLSSHDDMKVGSSFKLKDRSTGHHGHFMIDKVESDHVHVRHDESGRTVKMSKRELQLHLHREHASRFAAARKKVMQDKAAAEANQASPKQKARIEKRAAALGAAAAKSPAETAPEARKLAPQEMRVTKSKLLTEATETLRRAKKTALRKRRTRSQANDLNAALYSAAAYAMDRGVPTYVWHGNSYGHAVVHLAHKREEAFNVINNTGNVVFEVKPDKTIVRHDVDRSDTGTAEARRGRGAGAAPAEPKPAELSADQQRQREEAAKASAEKRRKPGQEEPSAGDGRKAEYRRAVKDLATEIVDRIARDTGSGNDHDGATDISDALDAASRSPLVATYYTNAAPMAGDILDAMRAIRAERGVQDHGAHLAKDGRFAIQAPPEGSVTAPGKQDPGPKQKAAEQKAAASEAEAEAASGRVEEVIGKALRLTGASMHDPQSKLSPELREELGRSLYELQKAAAAAGLHRAVASGDPRDIFSPKHHLGPEAQKLLESGRPIRKWVKEARQAVLDRYKTNTPVKRELLAHLDRIAAGQPSVLDRNRGRSFEAIVPTEKPRALRPAEVIVASMVRRLPIDGWAEHREAFFDGVAEKEGVSKAGRDLIQESMRLRHWGGGTVNRVVDSLLEAVSSRATRDLPTNWSHGVADPDEHLKPLRDKVAGLVSSDATKHPQLAWDAAQDISEAAKNHIAKLGEKHASASDAIAAARARVRLADEVETALRRGIRGDGSDGRGSSATARAARIAEAEKVAAGLGKSSTATVGGLMQELRGADNRLKFVADAIDHHHPGFGDTHAVVATPRPDQAAADAHPPVRYEKKTILEGATEAETAGDWGVHKDGSRWSVTHAPSGGRVDSFPTKGAADYFVRAAHAEGLDRYKTGDTASRDRLHRLAAHVQEEAGHDTPVWSRIAKDGSVRAASHRADVAVTEADAKRRAPDAFVPKSAALSSEDKVISRLKRFASTDTTRENINHIYVKDGKAVATDGHRLVIAPVHGIADGFIHPGTKQRVTSYASGKGSQVGRIDYPDVSRVIPASQDLTHEIDASHLRSAVEAAYRHGDPKRTALVKVRYKDGAPVAVVSDHADNPHGRYEGALLARPVPGSGAGTATRTKGDKSDGPFSGEIGFDAKYLMDALRTKGTVRLGISDQFSPVTIDHESGEKHVVMPMRA